MLTLSVKLSILSFNTNVTIFSLEMTCLSLWVFKNICQVAVLNALSHYEKYEQNQIFALSHWSFSFNALFQFYSCEYLTSVCSEKLLWASPGPCKGGKQVTVKDTVFIGVNLNGIMKNIWLWWHIWPICTCLNGIMKNMWLWWDIWPVCIHMHIHVHIYVCMIILPIWVSKYTTM